jgi:bifunctional DNA-binding transcriptional regulator/antitoxin component of YhaV-PrlF toxin-antitoxin module
VFLIVPREVGTAVSKTAQTDDRGRIVIPQEIREKYGERYRIVDHNDRVELIPLHDDPVDGLRDAVGDAFAGTPITCIKAAARDAARDHAIDEVTGSENPMGDDAGSGTDDLR